MRETVPFVCCFTGHREINPAHIEALSALLDRTLTTMVKSGVLTFRTGGAIGFDTMAALKVLEYKERDPRIRLELFLPCRDQSGGWADFNQNAYQYILERADAVTVLHEKYQRGCMFERNRAMVRGSHFCIGYCTTERGGSAYTMQFARGQGCRIINLYQLL